MIFQLTRTSYYLRQEGNVFTLSVCLFVCMLSVSWITQKLLDRFSQNSMERKRPLVLVASRFWIRIQKYLT